MKAGVWPVDGVFVRRDTASCLQLVGCVGVDSEREVTEAL